MTSTVNYRDTHFEQGNLTTIRGEPTFETVHKVWNEIKANARSMYSHLGCGTHGHLGLVLTAEQYADPTCIIGKTIFTFMSVIGGRLFSNHHKNMNHVHKDGNDFVSVVLALGGNISGGDC